MPEFQPKLLHTRIRVKNIEESIRFYTELFGFTASEPAKSPQGNQICFLTLPGGDHAIELAWSPDYDVFDLPEDIVHFAIAVSDLEEFRRKWEPEGIEFWPSDGPVNGHFYFIDDPNGYEIEVMKM